ncbi:MAG: glycosyltransferase family 4 protein [Gemmatales bacterium]|nr:glycosyltransferase family 4 protein [Gemmatales bacterium]MDW8385606.1 glycosyltransferase family 1 protein [Gemmatales bacterium]
MPTSSGLACDVAAETAHKPMQGTSPPIQRPSLRVALLADFAEENWPSMDLCAEAIRRWWPEPGEVTDVRPFYRRSLTRLPGLGQWRIARNSDRLLNRLLWYPRAIRSRATEFDVFHVVDHSYGALVHALPAKRTGVYFHDLDAFRCLVEPKRDPRPVWFRRMARHILAGVQKAAVVFHNTLAVRDEILRFGLIEPSRLIHAPHGICPEFSPTPEGSEPDSDRFPELRNRPYLLHVGSCIPRKRIDVLLNVFAVVRQQFPEMLLVQAGGSWTEPQREQIQRLGLEPSVRQWAGLSRAELAQLYRGARLVLLPSEAEGFGLPVIEALACGAVVVASDLPTLRETGGSAAVFAPVGNVAAWAKVVADLLVQPEHAPPREQRLAHAARFSWAEHARILRDTYVRLLERP